MKKFDDEYYFLRKPNGSQFPFLVPDENTKDRNFEFEAPALGSSPLVFYNGWSERNKKQNIMSSVPNVLFSGSDVIVNGGIREKLLTLEIPNINLHPTVYIDDQEEWHEDYWYLTFTNRLDCWDRDLSDYETEEPPIRLGGFELFQVYTYSLDDSIIERTPLSERQFFKMGATIDGFVTCHVSIISAFKSSSGSIIFQKITEY